MPVTIATLPVEIYCIIFTGLPDLASVISFASCCRPCWNAYGSSEKQILGHFIKSQLSQANVSIDEVVTAVEARDLGTNNESVVDQVYLLEHEWRCSRRPSWGSEWDRFEEAKLELETIMIDFVQSHPRNKSQKYNFLPDMPLDTVRKLVKLHEQVLFLVNPFIERLTSYHPITILPQAPVTDCTATELRRIILTIYHWETWARLMGCQGKKAEFPLGQPALSEDQQVSMYFDQFEPWEIEAITNLMEHIYVCYAEMFASVKELIAKDPLQLPGASEADKPPLYETICNGHWNRQLSCYPSYGIRLLILATQAHDLETRRSLLVNHMQPRGVGLDRVLYGVSDRCNSPLLHTPSEPPGWLWAFERFDQLGIPPYCDDNNTLREWGYTFWDKERLKEWGTVVGGPFIWDWPNGLRRRSTGEFIETRASPLWEARYRSL